MNYIEEKVEEFEKEYVDIQRNINGGIAYKEWSYKFDAEEALDWLRTTLTEVDRRARAERDEQWRTHLNVILGTELYKLHEKHFTNLTPNQ